MGEVTWKQVEMKMSMQEYILGSALEIIICSREGKEAGMN